MKSATTLMKWLLCFLFVTSTLMAQQTAKERTKRAKQVELFYDIAFKAYEKGDVKVARKAVNSALSLNRNHSRSIRLVHLMNTGGNQTVLSRRKRIFNSTMIPLIDLDDVNIKDAMTVLSKTIEIQSKGKIVPNFIIQDKDKLLDKRKITIKLRNVPTSNVLNHLLKSVNATAKFTKHTIVISPRITK